MLTQIFILLCSLFLVVFCANYLVEGSSVIARRLGVSEFFIGLLIVGFGTSLPELVVSLVGAVQHNSDIAIGNLIGSNVFNTSLILGLSALAMPIAVSESNRRRAIPFLMMATVMFIALGINSGGIGRIDGGVLLLLFALYLLYLFRTDGQNPEIAEPEAKSGLMFDTYIGCIGIVIGSLIGLIVGGNMFVNSAKAIGVMIGISDKIVGITILAFGTSLPELATCITAIFKKRSQMALGNIVGSNIFNILMIAGTASLIQPLGFANINIIDLIAVALSTFMLYVSQYTKHRGKFTRLDGGIMIAIFVAYMILLFKL